MLKGTSKLQGNYLDILIAHVGTIQTLQTDCDATDRFTKLQHKETMFEYVLDKCNILTLRSFESFVDTMLAIDNHNAWRKAQKHVNERIARHENQQKRDNRRNDRDVGLYNYNR